MIIKRFCKAGEPTAAIPLYLCQRTRETLPMWQRLPVEAMREELRQDIEQLDRFEYLSLNDAGELIAMMVIDSDSNPHYGSYLYPRYAFSTEKGALNGAYPWLKHLAKSLKYNGYLVSRQTGDYEITTRFKMFKKEVD